MVPPPRSALFVPASNPRAIAKAATLSCDALILDLEDAVAPGEKDRARRDAVAAIAGWQERIVIVRVNAPDTAAFADDMAALAGSAPAALLVPKIAGPRDCAIVRARTARPLWAMVERCAAVLALREIAAAAAGLDLHALVAGTNDLATEMRCRPGADRAPLIPVLSQMVVAARSAGLVALDAVSNSLDDPAAFRRECEQGRDIGFDGKTLIHPSQIDSANDAFGIGADELAWAGRIVAAFSDTTTDTLGAIRVDGAMVERLHLLEAQRVLAAAPRREHQADHID